LHSGLNLVTLWGMALLTEGLNNQDLHDASMHNGGYD
jgi:hypothetical protein